MIKKYDFKDVALISRQVSTVKSRDEIMPYTYFNNNEHYNPIIASPMKDVCNHLVANIVLDNGGLGILHRFYSLKENIEAACQTNTNNFASIGISGDYLERLKGIYDIGMKNFCIDIANSTNCEVKKLINNILDKYPDLNLIVGNIMSKEGLEYYLDIPNVKALRVGIAGGSGCTTKNKTGMYHPMVSLIQECAGLGKTIIADGGIKEPKDYCVALAAGADFVMIGGLIANTIESPAKLIRLGDKEYKMYSGSASSHNQSYYKEIPKYIEGRSLLMEHKRQSLVELMNDFYQGLVSSMSYANARTLDKYRKNVEFIAI